MSVEKVLIMCQGRNDSQQARQARLAGASRKMLWMQRCRSGDQACEKPHAESAGQPVSACASLPCAMPRWAMWNRSRHSSIEWPLRFCDLRDLLKRQHGTPVLLHNSSGLQWCTIWSPTVTSWKFPAHRQRCRELRLACWWVQ